MKEGFLREKPKQASWLFEHRELLIVLVFFFLAIGVRLALTGIRPLHHDEGVNGYFVSNIVEGRGWNYDPQNYHGPSFFYITALSFLVFGQSVFALRIVPIVFGSLMVLVPFLFRERLGLRGVAVSCFALAFSPALLYYSMFAIHETLFAFFSIASLALFLKFAEGKKSLFLYAGSASLALLFTTKEASFAIGPFIVLLAAIYGFLIEKQGFGLKSFFKKIWRWRKRAVLALLVFALIYSMLFTSFYSNPNGLSDSVRSVGLWGPRVVTEKGHDKPFSYYGELLAEYELPLLLLGIAGLALALWKKNRLFSLLGVFFLLLFVGISLVPYKTPWIVINLLPPLALLSGFFAKQLMKNTQKAGFLVIAVALGLMIVIAGHVNVSAPAGGKNRFSYVQTTMQAKEVLQKVLGVNGRIAVDIENGSPWPIPWLLRAKKTEYYSKDAFKTAGFVHGFDAVIVDRGTEESATKGLKGYEVIEFDLRPGMPLTAIIKQKKSLTG